MTDAFKTYIEELNRQYRTGQAREHSYRPALKSLIESLLPKTYTLVNEPAHIDCGAPDFLIMRDQMPVAFIEAKDLDDGDLDGKGKNHNQFNRYKQSLQHIVFTDYLDFHFYAEGELSESLRIAETNSGKIVPVEANFESFVRAVHELAEAPAQVVTKPRQLSMLMAAKARLLANTIEKALNDGKTADRDDSSLWLQLNAFRAALLADLDEHRFADLYAQTVVYGLFAARLNDDTPDTFSRQEAASLIPKTNPFLRDAFQHIAGYDVDSRIAWIIDDLVLTFGATDIPRVLSGFKRTTRQNDPMLHFYEDFLRDYDPKQKKSCGVYYTPEPVVDFIICAVDDLLKTDFHLAQGLADTSKTDVEIVEEDKITGKLKTRTERLHRVQILDPATGTGTFLAAVVRLIKQRLESQTNAWPQYVNQHLLPRLYGFELMMAPYTIAHLKLDMELGLRTVTNLPQTRLKVFMTNSLERNEIHQKTTLGSIIAREANEANAIKHHAPIMTVVGNPPYSVASANKSDFIQSLLADYKQGLNERNIQPLSDDYIKFIRLAQHYVERNGEGIVAFISNNSFIDGLIHRQMRKVLMQTFDRIYILDLHGNTRKKETTPDGTKDENVFDIMQGVSINIFCRFAEGSSSECQVLHHDLYGTREAKYQWLEGHRLTDISWTILHPEAPNFFFVPKDFSLQEEYHRGFRIDELMKVGACGIVSSRDSLLVQHTREELEIVKSDFIKLSEQDFRKKYNLFDSRDWTYKNAKESINSAKIVPINYRPFDKCFVLYSPKSKGVLSYPRYEIMRHLLQDGEKNIGLNVCKQQSTFDFQHVLISRCITDKCTISAQTKEASYLFPLYLYPNDDELGFGERRMANLDEGIWTTIENWVQYAQAYEPMTATEEAGLLDFDKMERTHLINPEQVFDYVYGVLHSLRYRERYKEFLKVDFPRIPYPKNAAEFEHYRSYGNCLRRLHLMDDVPEMPQVARLAVEGEGFVERIERTATGRVYINESQYFDDVPIEAWELYIGGYQPAQKWLKDRKGRCLTFDDIMHYHRIVIVLLETYRLMREMEHL